MRSGIEKPKTSDKAKPGINVVGLPWFVRWVLVLTIVSIASALIQTWIFTNLLDTTQRGVVFSMSLLLVGLVFYAAQAYELPFPVRQHWWPWWLFSALAATIGSNIYSFTVARVLINLMNSDALTVAVFAALFNLLSAVWLALVIGGVQWLLLRRYVSMAWLWIVALIVGGLAATFVSALVNAGLALFMTMDMVAAGWLEITRQGSATFMQSIISGLVLWWLIDRAGDNGA